MNHAKNNSTILLILTLCHAAVVNAAEPAAQKKPNILVILADDLGYGDVQSYNPEHGKIPTPHIDKLASQGMRFTDGHSSSGVCSPSRYSLLTGRYHWRTRLQQGIVGVFGDPLIAPDRMTIGTLAKQNGYRTAAIGKWHLGWDWPIPKAGRNHLTVGLKAGKDDEAPIADEATLSAWREIFSKPIAGGPSSRGFDSYFGTDVPNWPPYCFIENDHTIGIPDAFLAPGKLKKNLTSKQGPALKDWNLEQILPTRGERAASARRARGQVHHGECREAGAVSALSPADGAAHAAGADRCVEGEEWFEHLCGLRDADRRDRGPRA